LRQDSSAERIRTPRQSLSLDPKKPASAGFLAPAPGLELYGDVTRRSRTRKNADIGDARRRENTAPAQLLANLDPIAEALEVAHAAAVAVKDWARARALAAELEARHKALTAPNVLPLPYPARKKS
jgi:hypothetical protein